MAPALRLRNATLLLLLLAAMLGWLAWRWIDAQPGASPRDPRRLEEGDRPHGVFEALPELARRGAPATSDAPDPPGDPSMLVLHGRVLSEHGAPLERAFVYVLQDSWQGAYAFTDVPSTTTGSDGRFRLQTARISDFSLGAIAEGYLPQFLGANQVDSDGALVLRLARGPVVRVEVDGGNGDSTVQARVAISAAPPPGERTWLAPGRGSNPGFTILRELPPSGRVAVPVGTRGPVEVRAMRFGYFSRPSVVQLPGPGGTARFEFVPSCGVRVRVRGPDGLPLEDWVRFDLVDESTGRTINGAYFRSPMGEYDLADRIPPSRYVVRVSARGLATNEIQGVDLREPGHRHELTVQLQEDRERVRVRVVFPQLLRDASLRSRLAQTTVAALRRVDNTPRWEFETDTTWDPDAAMLELWRDPGDLPMTLIVFPEMDRVGVLEAGTAAAGQLLDVTMSLEPGLYWETPPPRPGEIGTPVHIAVESEAGSVLPPLAVKGSAVRTFSDPRDLPGPTVLGPFPGARIRTRVVFDTGAVHEAVVIRQAVEGR